MKNILTFTKTLSLILLTGFSYNSYAQSIDPQTDPQIESHVKAFLKVLNSGTGKPIEQLSPAVARDVLTGAQNSVKVDLSGISVTEKTIKEDGISVKITIVKPANAVA